MRNAAVRDPLARDRERHGCMIASAHQGLNLCRSPFKAPDPGSKYGLSVPLTAYTFATIKLRCGSSNATC